MKNNDQTSRGNPSRSFAQEMQQAFADWVRKLPFLKRAIPDDPDPESPGEASAGRASAPRPAVSVPAEEQPGHKGKPESVS